MVHNEIVPHFEPNLNSFQYPLINNLIVTNDVSSNNNAAAAEDQIFDEISNILEPKNVTKTDEENLAQNNQLISETSETTTENQATIDIDDTTKALETGIILLIDLKCSNS